MDQTHQIMAGHRTGKCGKTHTKTDIIMGMINISGHRNITKRSARMLASSIKLAFLSLVLVKWHKLTMEEKNDRNSRKREWRGCFLF